MSDFKNILEQKYLKGKSFEDIIAYASEQDIPSEEINSLLLSIHRENCVKRRNIAYRDLIIAIISISYALYWIYLMIYVANRKANILFIVSLFLWIPFLKSFFVVISNESKFKALKGQHE